jgi:sporulation protein YunB
MRNKKPFAKFGRVLIGTGLILIGLVLLADLRIRPLVIKTERYQSRIYAERIINAAVSEELSGLKNDTPLVTISTDKDGSVAYLHANAAEINRIKSQTALIVTNAVKNIDKYDLGVSVGTLTGIPMFYGKGFVIPIRIAPKGYAETQLISSFSESGINQTLHRIILRVSINLSAIIPLYTAEVNVTTDFIISETVIVGKIPDAFTEIIPAPDTTQDEIIGDINDYGADNYLR